MKFLNIGFNNSVSMDRVIAIVGADASTSRRLKDEAKKDKKLIDGTNGRKTRSMIVIDSGHVVLSSLEPETLISRQEGLLSRAAERRSFEEK